MATNWYDEYGRAKFDINPQTMGSYRITPSSSVAPPDTSVSKSALVPPPSRSIGEELRYRFSSPAARRAQDSIRSAKQKAYDEEVAQRRALELTRAQYVEPAQFESKAKIEAAEKTGESRVEAAGVTGKSRVEAAAKTGEAKVAAANIGRETKLAEFKNNLDKTAMDTASKEKIASLRNALDEKALATKDVNEDERQQADLIGDMIDAQAKIIAQGQTQEERDSASMRLQAAQKMASNLLEKKQAPASVGQQANTAVIQQAVKLISRYPSREEFVKQYPDEGMEWDRADAYAKAYQKKLQKEANEAVGLE